jgi:hypothetical protein
MPQFLHVTFLWNERVKTDELKPTFDLALDWIRYAPNCWILRTNTDLNIWVERFKPFLGVGDKFIVIEITEINKSQGWMQKFVWDWINKPR